MKTRGKVLREPNAGPGLLMIGGQQFRFSLAGVWKSEVPPKSGLNVEVELDNNLQVTGITVIPEPQIARESDEAAVPAAKEGFRKIGAKLGIAVLLAIVLLLAGWFVLTK